MNWLQFKQAVKRSITNVTPDDQMFAQACSLYVLAALSRYADHDLVARKSYADEFEEMRRSLAGYTPVDLVLGSTLNDAVEVYMPVDFDREGLESFVSILITRANAILTSYAIKLEIIIKAGVLDLQTFIPCYRTEYTTLFGTEDVVASQGASRGWIPNNGVLKRAFLIETVAVLAASTDYTCGQFVQSNQRVYQVVFAGTTPSDLGDGLVTEDGSRETLGSAIFIFISNSCGLETPFIQKPWGYRYNISRIPNDCCSRKQPPLICLDQELSTFYAWPPIVDASRQYRLIWSSIYADYSDVETVPLDAGAVEAIKEWVLAEVDSLKDEDPRNALRHKANYDLLRQRLFAVCSEKQKIAVQ